MSWTSWVESPQPKNTQPGWESTRGVENRPFVCAGASECICECFYFAPPRLACPYLHFGVHSFLTHCSSPRHWCTFVVWLWVLVTRSFRFTVNSFSTHLYISPPPPFSLKHISHMQKKLFGLYDQLVLFLLCAQEHKQTWKRIFACCRTSRGKVNMLNLSNLRSCTKKRRHNFKLQVLETRTSVQRLKQWRKKAFITRCCFQNTDCIQSVTALLKILKGLYCTLLHISPFSC